MRHQCMGQHQCSLQGKCADPAEGCCAQTLYFAEYDLAFFKTRPEMMRHLRKCKLQHPPGDEIYRRHYAGGRSVSMFEVRPERPPASQGLCCAFETCCHYAGSRCILV